MEPKRASALRTAASSACTDGPRWRYAPPVRTGRVLWAESQQGPRPAGWGGGCLLQKVEIAPWALSTRRDRPWAWQTADSPATSCTKPDSPAGEVDAEGVRPSADSSSSAEARASGSTGRCRAPRRHPARARATGCRSPAELPCRAVPCGRSAPPAGQAGLPLRAASGAQGGAWPGCTGCCPRCCNRCGQCRRAASRWPRSEHDASVRTARLLPQFR